VQLQNFFPLSHPSSVFLNAYGGTSYGYKTGIPRFYLGGVTRFAAFGANELLTNQYFLFQTGYIRKLKNLPPLLGTAIDVLGMFEIGKTYQPPFKLPGDVAGALIVRHYLGRSSRWRCRRLRPLQILLSGWENLLRDLMLSSAVGERCYITSMTFQCSRSIGNKEKPL
jgi:hypothetical protein